MRLPVIRRLTSAALSRSLFTMVIQRGIYHRERLTKPLMDSIWQPLQEQSGKAGFIQLIKCINNRLLTDISDQLRQLTMPVLVIRGDADAYLSEQISDFLLNQIPNARIEHIAHGGHFIQYDEPAKVTSLLLTFIGQEQ